MCMAKLIGHGCVDQVSLPQSLLRLSKRLVNILHCMTIELFDSNCRIISSNPHFCCYEIEIENTIPQPKRNFNTSDRGLPALRTS